MSYQSMKQRIRMTTKATPAAIPARRNFSLLADFFIIVSREARAKEWANFQQEACARVARLEARDREQEEAIRRRYLFLENDPL